MSTTTTQEETAKRVIKARTRVIEARDKAVGAETAAASAIQDAIDYHWKGDLWTRDERQTLTHCGLMRVEYARAFLDLAREVRKNAREIEEESRHEIEASGIDIDKAEAIEAERAAANVARLRGE